MPKNSKKSIKYPIWKIRGKPTPNEKLMICDGCGTAKWSTDSSYSKVLYCDNCQGKKGGYLRMRKATLSEIKEAKKYLKEII